MHSGAGSQGSTSSHLPEVDTQDWNCRVSQGESGALEEATKSLRGWLPSPSVALPPTSSPALCPLTRAVAGMSEPPSDPLLEGLICSPASSLLACVSRPRPTSD